MVFPALFRADCEVDPIEKKAEHVCQYKTFPVYFSHLIVLYPCITLRLSAAHRIPLPNRKQKSRHAI
ncbi:hypothetical protein CR161_03705 [Prosthecochloris sp. ZM]|nr:hypothetical protein [Prosthecochloris sp.]RDD29885.1 hypothetical protein CR161_03705 [Prosthecochloris sp. ZM]